LFTNTSKYDWLCLHVGNPTYNCTCWATVCKTVCPMLSVRCPVRPVLFCPVLSCPALSCPACNVRALWPNGWTDQDETWHAGYSRPRPWPHCVNSTQLNSTSTGHIAL